MTTILLVESSLFPAVSSASRRIAGELVERWLEREPGALVVRRDLAAEPPQYFSLALLTGAAKTPDARSDAERLAVDRADRLIAELLEADVIVIGAPMHNYSIPTPLKSWIDSISVPGRTFRFTSDGHPEGLVRGKKVFIIASRGGIYSDGPLVDFNFQDTYLRATLGLLGMTDVDVATVERQNMGPEQKMIGRESAIRQIDVLLGQSLAI